ncbi:MAG: hypothetical protein ACRDRX_04475 [Pseudonocardiaceae bacterium]
MGLIEESVRLNISALDTAHPMSDALAETAYMLAAALDTGVCDSIPATSRELRATLAELASVTADDDDDLAASLSAPIRHT